MINELDLKKLNLNIIERYHFDEYHSSLVCEYNNICIIIDDNICQTKNNLIFDYSKYCDMQNKYMKEYSRLYRFNYNDKTCIDLIKEWLEKTPEDIVINDDGGSFDNSHIDNTPLEKNFEDLFLETYGDEARKFLKKEYSISLNNGKNAFVDYVIETKNGNIAIEENGVHYHHPVIIGNKRYNHQLEKQNILSLYRFKIYRFSIENITFTDQAIDKIKQYLGNKDDFIDSLHLKETRKFKLYQHQTEILKHLKASRSNGEVASLIVIPTGTGKSQIAIEDINNLYEENLIHNALIMVPSNTVKSDWLKRIKVLPNKLNINVKFYNTVFLERNALKKDYYDYILFDEAHHAQAANCKKTLQYFTPKFLVGLTATPERLDKQKIEEIFGQYESQLTLKDAIEKGIISNIRCFRLMSNIDLSNVRYNGKDYNNGDLERTLIVDSRNELIVQTIIKYFSPKKDFYKQGIVFCVNIDHCKKLEKLFNENGIVAKAVYGSNKDNDKIFLDYQNKKVQFLLSCQIISEGWDSPQTEIIVMARPTLSKVLYLQQIGRGVRKYKGKECLYVIDVVDNYDAKLTPWNFNSIFKINTYMPFKGIINNNIDYLSIFGLSEKEMALEEIDVFTFEEKYQGFLSLEQTARDLYIGTETLNKWVKKEKSLASLYLPIGNKLMPYFSSNDINYIREKKKLSIHNEDTILNDFIDFIDENTLTFSFKLVFMLGMLKLCDKEGEVNLDNLINYYVNFYKSRIERNLKVDRNNCIYTLNFLNDKAKIKKNILENPFEKFERKRFIYFSKDLNVLAFNPYL